MAGRVILIPLFRGYRATTEGTSLTDTAVAINAPTFGGLLPQTESLTLHYFTAGRSTNFEWSVFLIPGFDREHEATAVNLNGASYISTAVPGRVDYTTTANFLLDGRLELRFRNASGTAGVNSGLVSAVLAVRTYGT